ncbi:MAG: hypothetical protein HGN29_11360 [Asgard group archaeon]|nr:hypothetical protein [Asgard group archaeon]
MSATKKIYLSFLLISCFILLQPLYCQNMKANQEYSHITSSCTIFTAVIGDTVLFGNNEDYKLNNAYRWYVPAQNVSTTYFGYKEIYGAVFFGFDNNNNTDVDTWEQGGMNEFGLCFDGNGLPDVQLNLNPSSLYPYTPNALAQVLWDCKNVSEVINWYQNHKWSGTFGGQIHYADTTGDAVVVSVNSTGQWIFTRIDSAFLVSTNFNLADVNHGEHPCWRYDTATQMFGEINAEEDLTVSKCANILYAVHQEGMYATKYSNICDPVNLEFYFNSGDEFSVSTKINLLEKLAESESYEQKNEFFGVTGIDGGVLVKTEKIDIQFETSENTETESTETSILFVILSLSVCVFVYGLVKKRNQVNVTFY